MERLRNWIDKLRRPQADELPPRVDQFNPTQADVDERKRELLEKDEEKSDHNPDRYES